MDDSIQSYPTKMSISNCSTCEESEELELALNYHNSIQTSNPTYLAGHMEALALKLSHCPYLGVRGREIYMEKITSGHKGVAAAFLISVFQNLQNLEFFDCSSSTANLRVMVSKISNAIKNTEEPMSTDGKCDNKITHVLGKPSHVSVANSVRMETGEDFETIEHFLGLPSMRSLHGREIDGERYTWDNRVSSGITRVDLERNFRQLLKNVTGLEHLKYQHYGNIGCAYWEPYKIVRSLTNAYQYCLRLLDLTGHRFIERRISEDANHYIGLLHKFRELKLVRVHGVLELLPASVESLTLASKVEKGMATEMVKEIAMRKNLRFQDILLEEENDLDDKIEKACEKFGIVIKQLRRMT